MKSQDSSRSGRQAGPGPVRDAALRFLTHDLRAPSSSILTLLELHRINPQSMPVAELLARIEGKTRETLALADAFVNLHGLDVERELRAEAADLVRLATQASDEVWPLARDAGVQVRIDAPVVGEASCEAEPESLQRAIEYLLGYAVRWSRAGSEVVCTVAAADAAAAAAAHQGGWCVRIDDPGPAAARERLSAGADTLDLRLAYAACVAARHGGALTGIDEGVAARWQLLLPAAGQPMAPGTADDGSAGR